MDIDAKLTLLEGFESFAELRDAGHGIAAAGWLTAPQFSDYAAAVMLASAALGFVGKMAGKYRKRLEARLAAQPLANGV